MNARRKARFRYRQYWRLDLTIKNQNPGEPPSKICNRCEKPFEPVWNNRIGFWSRCCRDCGNRNLYDMLELKTPPALLDKHTVSPALTDDEFLNQFNDKFRAKLEGK